jgi:hypothetical protein
MRLICTAVAILFGLLGFVSENKLNADITQYRACQLACAKQVNDCFDDVKQAWGDTEEAAGPRNYCKTFIAKCQVDCGQWGNYV